MKTKKRKRKILCPNCKTGEESYIIDPSSPVCPYFSCYNGFWCGYYVSRKEKDKRSIFLKKLNHMKELFKKYK